jgi:hypothetical protein
MDFTGYRHNPATQPTTVMTASINLEGALAAERGMSSVADLSRRSASRHLQDATRAPPSRWSSPRGN